MSSVDLINGFLYFQWESIVGQSYRVEYKDDINVTQWQLERELNATKTLVSVEIPYNAQTSQRFYRVVSID